jgi:phosphoribosylglycinamide formyltransferase 1
MSLARLVVLASGGGSNLQAIVDACATGDIAAEVVLVVSDQPDAPALQRVPPDRSCLLMRNDGETRRDYDSRLRAVVAAAEPDWVVMAGWMRIVTMAFLDGFASRVINLHPALPGELAGTHAIERAFDEAQRNLRTHSGVMVHLVPDEGVDCGPVLATVTVPIGADDTLEAFAATMHRAEHQLLVSTLQRLVSNSHLDAVEAL